MDLNDEIQCPHFDAPQYSMMLSISISARKVRTKEEVAVSDRGVASGGIRVKKISDLSSIMVKTTPNLIPVEFTVKQARRQYHLRQSAPTWIEMADHYFHYIVVAVVLATIFGILYLKYQEKKSQGSNKQQPSTRKYIFTDNGDRVPEFVNERNLKSP